jgi:hypothetical protein
MKTCAAIFVLLISLISLQPVSADELDLSSAAFITHFPPNFVYSAGEDWTAMYHSDYQINELEAVNPSIPDGVYTDVSNQAVWYVLASFCDGEDKEWAGVQFGFGDYNPDAFYFSSSAPCLPNTLEIPSSGWPGPNSGVAVARTEEIWTGNFQPLYYFEGYQYAGTALISISGYDYNGNWLEPAIANDLTEVWYITDPDRLGALGVGIPGESVECNGTSSTDELSWGQIKLLHK